MFPPSQRAKLATKQAYYNRLIRTNDQQIALYETQPMARAFFGEALETAIEELNRQYWIVQLNVDSNYAKKTEMILIS